MNDTDTVLQMMLVELRECHPDKLGAAQRRIIDYFNARPAIEPHTFTGLPDTTYEKLVAKEKAADLERYGQAPTMRAMEPSPEWLARHKAAGDLLRAAKDVLHNFHVDMEHEQRRGFYGPQDVDAMHAMGDAIEAAERAGVR